MHHSDRALPMELRDSLFPGAKVGPTGCYPEGKLTEQDEGEIQFTLGSDPNTGKVVIDFGTPIAWLGMNATQARDLAECLKKHARRASGVIEKEPPTRCAAVAKK